MYKSIQILIMLFFCANTIESLFDCPEMTPMPDFDIDKFLGIWYGVQSENEIPSCEMYNVARSQEPFKYVVATETRLSTTNRKYKTSFTENLSVIDYDLPSKMSCTPLPRISDILSIRSSLVVESNFTVIKTDYTSYALVHKCDGYVHHSKMKNENIELCSNHAKLWSRKPDLNDKFYVKMLQIAQHFTKLDAIIFGLGETTNRTGCEVLHSNTESSLDYL